ncbi:hypothetical protein [Kitasatospora cinereorecta]|uniref:Secreted protein n=1 Tax=Kitasatospora cinereorecta TaxID=285560 RepID=A0ABW0VFU2_9ACTN
MTDHRKHLARTAAEALLATALGLAAAPAATAADASAPLAPVPGADLAAARGAVQAPAVLDQLGHFFARRGVPPTQPSALSPAQEAQAAAEASPRLSGDTVPVYSLAADFVAGSPGAAVARAEFTATRAVSADGQVASVWTVRQGGSWKVVDIASGGDETDYAARAAAGGGGTAFREPQIDAWYVLRGGRVLPLDDAARRSVGDGGVSLAGYQKLVHQRYGDKLPGSAYDRAGRGGGYAAEPPAAGDGAVGGLLPATAAAALGATALAGVGLALRRRKAVGQRV